MKILRLSKSSKDLKGLIKLRGSKSISNRVLIIRALSPASFNISNLATADDTTVLDTLLKEPQKVYDVGHAGTSFRFLTAYLSLQEGSQVLTGSSRMKERPIKPLVEALRSIGADIEYLEKEGFPPLRIHAFDQSNYNKIVSLPADISSQFISALLLISPCLPEGLQINMKNEAVSRPYIQMTLDQMAYFGVKFSWKENCIEVPSQEYKSRDLTIESDWSAASYYFALAASARALELRLDGLFENSIQGDSEIMRIAKNFGINSFFEKEQCVLQKSLEVPNPHFEYDFIEQPDLAQTVSIICASLEIEAVFTGLKTLKIKETDRVLALQQELQKVNVSLIPLPSRFSKKTGRNYYLQSGKAAVDTMPRFCTYKDHRMAMAFSILSMYFPLEIEEPDVVNKSYPGYWQDLESLGFELMFYKS